ncbi:protoporphyrinogen oxidase [Arthrobacter sp. Hiyo8]|nr:protoporphyrinogen oxidase [Arthrobacter sp. Hiyo8]
MNTLVSALVAELRSQGVALVSGARVDAISRTESGWQASAAGTTYDAVRLVVALDGPAAVGLLEGRFRSCPRCARRGSLGEPGDLGGGRA